jgi:DNA-binding SARP family transcriptional activator
MLSASSHVCASERLRIQLIGPPRLWHDEADLCGRMPPKQQAVLFVLALEGPTVARGRLCQLLWADLPEASARANLRVVLSHLRRAWPGGLAVEAQQVTLRQTALSWALPSGWHGGLLSGFELHGCDDFADWLTRQRQRAADQAVQGCRARMHAAEASGDVRAAMGHARRLLDIDGADEAAHMTLMGGLALHGERTAALRQYQACCTALAEQFGARPSARCYALYVRIHADTLPTRMELLDALASLDSLDSFDPMTMAGGDPRFGLSPRAVQPATSVAFS